MKIDDFNWEALYKKCDDFMRNIRANEYSIATNKKNLAVTEPVVEVFFPKRINTLAIMKLDKNNACIRRKGYKNDGKLFCVYDVYVNRLN